MQVLRTFHRIAPVPTFPTRSSRSTSRHPVASSSSSFARKSPTKTSRWSGTEQMDVKIIDHNHEQDTAHHFHYLHNYLRVLLSSGRCICNTDNGADRSIIPRYGSWLRKIAPKSPDFRPAGFGYSKCAILRAMAKPYRMVLHRRLNGISNFAILMEGAKGSPPPLLPSLAQSTRQK